MDNEGFSCMQSQQVRTTDNGRYNKMTCTNRAVTKISLALSVQLSISESQSSDEEEDLWTFIHPQL